MTELPGRLEASLADRYKIERHLGEGGMANVYLAEDLKHDRKVAVKVLRPELSAILGGERFLNEIKVTANLQHPNILPLYDSGDADGLLYYVMPYFEGETLRDKLDREKQLGIEEALKIAQSVAAALDYAHQQGLVHRDIKPENILLQSGQALVADFGIALAVSQAGGTRLTETGLSLGTPRYMSPEQATGDRVLDARSDIYSLGAVVYEMLAGEPPHTGNTVQAVIARILSTQPDPIATHRTSVPVHVDMAIHKALDKTPADRFSSATKFAEALTDSSFTVPTVASTPAARLPSDRSWNGVSVAGWGLAAVFALLFFWRLMSPEPPRPVTRYSVALPQVLFEGVSTTTRLALTPDGQRLVYVGVGADSQRRLLERARDQLDANEMPGTTGGSSPFVSPDGESVAYFMGGGALRVAAFGGAPPVTLADSGFVPLGGSWGEDGYIYGTNSDGLVRVDARSGEVERLSTLSETACNHFWPRVLPNTRGVLFTLVDTPCGSLEDFQIAVLDLKTMEHHVLIGGVQAWYAESGHLVVVSADGTILAAPFDQDDFELGAAVPVADGVAIRQLGSLDLSLSETGRLVYVAGAQLGGTSNEAAWVTRNGTEARIDPGWQFSAVGNAGWAVSPEGERLALKINTDAGQDIYIKRLEAGPLSRLTFDPGNDIRPRWSPDGRVVSFMSDRDGQYELYQRRADGTGSAEKVLDWDRSVLEAVWSRDGAWLVVRTGGVAGQVGGRDIWAMRLGVDSLPSPLVTSQFDERAIALSSDSRWLAYESDESGRTEVYVRPFPNVEGGKWQVSSSGGGAPLWARSVTELFYITTAAEVVVAKLIPGDEFVWTTEPLFTLGTGYTTSVNYTFYDVTPDDERFIFVRTPQDARRRSEMIVVENFFEELREKVGNE